MDTTLIYLHGFLSSPESLKAVQSAEFAAKHYPELNIHIPQLPCYPLEAKAFLQRLMDEVEGQRLGFIGSSLGGFLSTWLVEHYGGRGVLINPAVEPFILLADYLGEQQNPYSKERFVLKPDHMQHLRQMHVPSLADPSRYKVLLQTDDEVLDYRQAANKYAQSDLLVEQGGDHSFIDYQRHLPAIFDFLFGDPVDG